MAARRPATATPVTLFHFTPEQLTDENLDATVEEVMAAIEAARASRAPVKPIPPAPTSRS